jgi:hypothetical protein
VTDPERIIKWIPAAQGAEFTYPVCLKCDLEMTLARTAPVPGSAPARVVREFACGCGAKVTIEVPAAKTDDIAGDVAGDAMLPDASLPDDGRKSCK